MSRYVSLNYPYDVLSFDLLRAFVLNQKWDCNISVGAGEDIGTLTLCMRFRTNEDAIMFHLKYGVVRMADLIDELYRAHYA